MINRRNFLTAMGLASGSLFLPSLSRRAVGAPGDPPTRLIVVVTQHGGWMPTWAMNPANNPSDAVWQQDLSGLTAAEFSPSLAPLEPYADRMIAIEGLSMVSGDIDPAGVLRHEIGQVHTLTGNEVEMIAGLPQAKSPSIDQMIADHIARPDRLRSLELSVEVTSPVVNYRDRLQPIVGEHRIPVVYQRLFGLVNGGATGSDLSLQQSSVLALAEQGYTDLAAKLSSEDRQKLEVHRDLVRDLQGQIDGLSSASCEVPVIGEAANFKDMYTAMVTMLTAAMSCDLLRVATINLPTLPGEEIGLNEEVHDAYAHQLATSDAAVQVMTDYMAYHSAQVAELCALLDGIPEGNGTMLDNTLILWTSELADGIHGFDRMPVVMLGGQTWQTGRYIHYPSDTPYEAWVWDGIRRPSSGRPHQKLLSSVMRAFGVPDPTTGGDWSAMPIKELSGMGGAKIDCTGVLDELWS